MADKYKVIEIMNEKELIVNYGSNDGAEVEDVIRIYSIGEEVIDPETNIVIGTLDIIKDELEVYIIYKNFSICRKLVRTSHNPILSPLANISRTKVESMVINIDNSDITGRKLPNNPPPIKVGDSVIVLK